MTTVCLFILQTFFLTINLVPLKKAHVGPAKQIVFCGPSSFAELYCKFDKFIITADRLAPDSLFQTRPHDLIMIREFPRENG